MPKNSETKIKERRVSFDKASDEIPQTESLVGVTDIQRELEIWDEFLHPQSSEPKVDGEKEQSGETDFVEQNSGFPGVDKENALHRHDLNAEPTSSKDRTGHQKARVKSPEYHSETNAVSGNVTRSTSNEKHSLEEVQGSDEDLKRTFSFKNKILEKEEHQQRRTSDDRFHTDGSVPFKDVAPTNKSIPRTLSLEITDIDGHTTVENVDRPDKVGEDSRKTMPASHRNENVTDDAVISAVHEYQKRPGMVKSETQSSDGRLKNVPRVHSAPVETTKEEKDESKAKGHHTVGHQLLRILRHSSHDDHISEESLNRSEVEEMAQNIQDANGARNKDKFKSYSSSVATEIDTTSSDKNERRHTVAHSFERDGSSLESPVEPLTEEDVTKHSKPGGTQGNMKSSGVDNRKMGKSQSVQASGTKRPASADKSQRRNTHAHDQPVGGVKGLQTGVIDQEASSENSTNGRDQKQVSNTRKIAQKSQSMQSPASKGMPEDTSPRRKTVSQSAVSTAKSPRHPGEKMATTSNERQTTSSDKKTTSIEGKVDGVKKPAKVAFSNDVSFKPASDFKENSSFGMVRNADIKEIYDKDEIYYDDSGKALLHSTPSNQCARKLINNAVEKGRVQYTSQTEELFGASGKKRKIKFDEKVDYSDNARNKQKAASDEKTKAKKPPCGSPPAPIMKPFEEDDIVRGPTRRKDTAANFTAHPPNAVQRRGTLELMRTRPKYLKRKDTIELMEMKGKRKSKEKEDEVLEEHGAGNQDGEVEDEEDEEDEEVEEECIEETITDDLGSSHAKGVKLKKKTKKKKAKNTKESTDDTDESEEEAKSHEPFSKITALLESLNKIGTIKPPKVAPEEIIREDQTEELEMASTGQEELNDKRKFGTTKGDGSDMEDSHDSDKTSQEQERNGLEVEGVMLKNAKYLASDTVLSALDEIFEEVETSSDDSTDVDNAKSDSQGMESDVQGKKPGSHVSESSSRSHVKPLYSVSVFEKNAAEFLAATTTSLTSNVATIDSKTTRSSTISSSGNLPHGESDVEKKVLLEAQKKKGRRNTVILSRQKRPSTARPPEKDISYRRHTTHSSPPTGRGSFRRMSQFENSRMYQRLQERHRMQSIDQLTNFMGPISSGENMRQKKPQDHRKLVTEHIEPSVVHMPPEPPSVKDFAESQTKFSKDRRSTVGMDKYEKAPSSSLSNMQFIAFRRLFTKLNKSATAGLTADDLYYAIQDLLPDVEISFEEARSLLKEFDLKGTGEINFDEFLYAMTHPTNYLKLLTDEHKALLDKEIELWEKMTYKQICRNSVTPVSGSLRRGFSVGNVGAGIDKKKSLFFKMLKTAAVKYSIKEIPDYYATKIQKLNDHVVHHWSSGQRCTGLSVKHIKMKFDELKRQMLRSARTNKDFSDSPYAVPLIWDYDHAMEFEKKKEKERQIFIERAKAAGFFRKQSYKPRPRSVEPARSKRLVLKVERRRPASARPDMSRKLKLLDGTGYRVVIKTRTNVKKMSVVPKRAKRKDGRRPIMSQFICTPKMVSLPKFHSWKIYDIKVNYDELPGIRQRAARVLERYYSALKRIAATNARKFYDKLYVEQMPPRMRQIFTESYRAYSGDNEPFVVSPWIPSPGPTPLIPYPPLGKSCPKEAWNPE